MLAAAYVLTDIYYFSMISSSERRLQVIHLIRPLSIRVSQFIESSKYQDDYFLTSVVQYLHLHYCDRL